MIADQLPGKPKIVFQNLPGGGGIKANNYFHAKVKPDGLTALAGSRTQVSPYKLRHKSVKYDPGKYRYIGGTARLGTIILINKDAKIQARLLDKKAKPVAFGAIDGERTGDHAAVWAMEYLGWNIKFVLGYPGTSEMLLAARRGEVDMVNNQTVFNVMPLMNDNMKAIIQLGNRDENNRFVERVEFKGVPVLGDLLKDKLDAKAARAYAGWLDDQTVEKWLALPGGTPDNHVEAWRKAHDVVMKDPKFVEIAKREYGDDFGWYTGKQMDDIVKNLVATTDEDLAFFINLRKKHGLPIQ
jgi:tripartite-type tricarboxylate transporter receptor subunit TctC